MALIELRFYGLLQCTEPLLQIRAQALDIGVCFHTRPVARPVQRVPYTLIMSQMQAVRA